MKDAEENSHAALSSPRHVLARVYLAQARHPHAWGDIQYHIGFDLRNGADPIVGETFPPILQKRKKEKTRYGTILQRWRLLDRTTYFIHSPQSRSSCGQEGKCPTTARSVSPTRPRCRLKLLPSFPLGPGGEALLEGRKEAREI